eukprot:6188539-Lingulodinium_polyedra.AAC.1
MEGRGCGSAHHAGRVLRPTVHEHCAGRRTLRSLHRLRRLPHRPRAPGVSWRLGVQDRRGRGATDTQ